jgi:transmembrane sensor
MANVRLTYLFERWTAKTATEEEKAEWLSMVTIPENELAVRELITLYLRDRKEEEPVSMATTAGLLQSILGTGDGHAVMDNHAVTDDRVTIEGRAPMRRNPIIPIRQGRPRRVRQWTAAAAILLSLVTGALYITQRSRPTATKPATARRSLKEDAPPGTDRAILTLGDGSTVTLDSTGNKVIRQGGAVVNQRNGRLLYEGKNADSTVYNTLTTPRGCQFRVRLPDGTQVWLNAASSLRYPVAFTGRQRMVELTGEGYFEVAEDKLKPFQVKVGEMKADVLGTHFNIMAYGDEDGIRTTLTEGAVRVVSADKTREISPGQQAIVRHGSTEIQVSAGDVEGAVAWKDGYFQFEGIDLPVLLRQFGRWYNIDIVYKGQKKAYEFMGRVPRTAQLSSVLKILKLNDISYQFRNDQLIIEP